MLATTNETLAPILVPRSIISHLTVSGVTCPDRVLHMLLPATIETSVFVLTAGIKWFRIIPAVHKPASFRDFELRQTNSKTVRQQWAIYTLRSAGNTGLATVVDQAV